MRPPEHVTFTGAGDPSQIPAMRSIHRKYPGRVEWGILLSESQAGTGRYPRRGDSADFFRANMYTSAHVCGELARLASSAPAVFKARATGDWMRFAFEMGSGPGAVQINHSEPQLSSLRWLRKVLGKRIIAQCRARAFPASRDVEWIFDQSGGRGETPQSIPPHYQKRLVGYAGGIGPANVLAFIERINGASGDNCGPYWLDMESSLRGPGDTFDLGAVEQVLETIATAFPSWQAGTGFPPGYRAARPS